MEKCCKSLNEHATKNRKWYLQQTRSFNHMLAMKTLIFEEEDTNDKKYC